MPVSLSFCSVVLCRSGSQIGRALNASFQHFRWAASPQVPKAASLAVTAAKPHLVRRSRHQSRRQCEGSRPGMGKLRPGGLLRSLIQCVGIKELKSWLLIWIKSVRTLNTMGLQRYILGCKSVVYFQLTLPKRLHPSAAAPLPPLGH